jgi:hypothetical protein
MAKAKDKIHADTDRQWRSLLQQAEAEARTHLPQPPYGKPTPWSEEPTTIVSATGERRPGAPMPARTVPYDPDKEAARFTRDELLTPFRLDTEIFLKNKWQQGMPVAFAEHAHTFYLAFVLLALCRYAKSNDLTPEERFIVGHNMAVLRMSLRYPEIRKTAATERGYSGQQDKQTQYESAKAFSRTHAVQAWKEDKTDPPTKVARFIHGALDAKALKEFGLTKKPTVNQIRGWIIDLAPAEAKQPGRRSVK